MKLTSDTLTRFIESFAHHSATRNFSAVVEHFADTFLAAGPSGAHCIRATDFGRALPRRTELFESLGCKPAELLHVQPTWIDDRYAIVRTIWRFIIRPGTGEADTVDSVSLFLVDTEGEACRILAYINPQDILATIRQRGPAA